MYTLGAVVSADTIYSPDGIHVRPGKESEDKITVAYAVYSSSPERPWHGYSFHYNK